VIDRENIYIATNELSILGPAVNGAQISAISKRDLIAGASKVHFVQFENLTIAGDIAFSVQPASAKSPAHQPPQTEIAGDKPCSRHLSGAHGPVSALIRH
jgi:hypothetical protein